MDTTCKLWKSGERACRRLEEEFALWEAEPKIDGWRPGGRVLLQVGSGADWQAVVAEFARRSQVPVHTVTRHRDP